MNRKRRRNRSRGRLILASLIFIAVLGGIALALVVRTPSEKPLEGISIQLYKDELCQCCDEYAGYLRSLGASVSLEIVDVGVLSDRLGIPYDLRSCHISIVEGYVVVGHMPAEAIKKLLSEKPGIKGISLPGMPQGSPGMPGVKREPFTIYSFDGGLSIFAVI